jgi:hypothetical protein
VRGWGARKGVGGRRGQKWPKHCMYIRIKEKKIIDWQPIAFMLYQNWLAILCSLESLKPASVTKIGSYHVPSPFSISGLSCSLPIWKHDHTFHEVPSTYQREEIGTLDPSLKGCQSVMYKEDYIFLLIQTGPTSLFVVISLCPWQRTCRVSFSRMVL